MSSLDLSALVGAAVRELPNFPGYAISSTGRVFSVKYNLPRQVHGTLYKGYVRLGLRIDGQPRKMFLHRLVALAYCGPAPYPGAVVRHLDGNPLNNDASNLAWGTPQDNADDTRRHGRRAHGSDVKTSRLTAEQVQSIRAEITSGRPLRVIGERFGVSQTTIWSIKHRLTWQYLP